MEHDDDAQPCYASLALSLLTLAASAHAQTGPTGFQSPSKNIACQYFDYDRQNMLRCDIDAMETSRAGRPIATSNRAAPSR